MGEGIFSLSFTEIIIVLFLAFLLLKPNEYNRLFTWFGVFLRRILQSDEWKTLQRMTRELKNMPARAMRESAESELKQGFDRPVIPTIPGQKTTEGGPSDETK